MNFYGSLKRLTTIEFRQNSNEIVLEPNQGTTYTATRTLQLPPGDASFILVGDTTTQTLTNKTLTNPVVTGETSTAIAVLALRDTSAAFDVTVAATSSTTLTNGRTLTLDLVNGNRTLSLSGNLTTAGGNALTLTTTGTTNVTLPTSGTLMTNPMTTAGDTIYGGASGVPTRLAAGTATQVLHGGTTPSWAAVSLTADVSGTLPVANGGTGTTTSTGTGSVVLSTSPTLVTPALGTPSAAVLTNATGLPLTSGVTGTLPIANGGTNATTAAAAFNNLNPMTTTGDTIYESGTNTAARLPIGTTGQILTVVGGIPAWASPGSSSDFKANWVTGDGTTKTVTHNLGTLDIAVQLYDKTDGSTIEIDSVVRTDTNTLTLTSSEAPGAAGWRVLIQSV